MNEGFVFESERSEVSDVSYNLCVKYVMRRIDREE